MTPSEVADAHAAIIRVATWWKAFDDLQSGRKAGLPGLRPVDSVLWVSGVPNATVMPTDLDALVKLAHALSKGTTP